MTVVNMLEAKTNLTKLIRLLETKQEDEIVIARKGNPVAVITVYEKKRNHRIGICKGQYKSVSLEDFNQLDKEIWGDLY